MGDRGDRGYHAPLRGCLLTGRTRTSPRARARPCLDQAPRAPRDPRRPDRDRPRLRLRRLSGPAREQHAHRGRRRGRPDAGRRTAAPRPALGAARERPRGLHRRRPALPDHAAAAGRPGRLDAAVANAQRQGDGFGFVRGYRRLELELFPQDVVPPTKAYDAGLNYKLQLLARAIDRPHREARLVRRGLHISIAAGATGRTLDRAAARDVIVAALASFSRAAGRACRFAWTRRRVTVASLTARQRTASRIISAPVTLTVGPTRFRLPRWRLAKLLDLSTMRLTGPAADAYFARLEKTVDTPPKDADFATPRRRQRARRRPPARASRSTSRARRRGSSPRRAACRTASRRSRSAVSQPTRSTAEAEAMGITGTVGAYETFYGGIANRIHNVQLVAHLVDHKFIAPGETFSFNNTTGERSAAKGFLEAPVIVNGELQTGLGGGVCQVSTTVFNAAYEAGLPITARTNHALYISHYPLGRDATVDYPGIDLKFVNDTKPLAAAAHLRRLVVADASASTATPQHRRVESVDSAAAYVAPPPVQKTVDATLEPGEVVVDDFGVPAQTTSVERKVYARAASCSPTRRGTRATARAEDRARRPEAGEEEAPEADRHDDDHDDDYDDGRRDEPPPPVRTSDRLREPRRDARRAQRRRRRPSHAPSSRPRSPRRRARSRTRSGSARPSRRRSARGRRARSSKRAGWRYRTCVSSTSASIAEVAQPLVAARVLLEVVDARDLEPDEVVRVVRDPLRVRLGEPHPDSVEKLNPCTRPPCLQN